MRLLVDVYSNHTVQKIGAMELLMSSTFLMAQATNTCLGLDRGCHGVQRSEEMENTKPRTAIHHGRVYNRSR